MEEEVKEDIFDIFNGEDVKDEKGEEGETVPYHQNDRIQKYIDKQIKKRTQALESNNQNSFQDSNDDLMEALTQLVGNDTDEKKKFLDKFGTTLKSREEKSVEKAFEKLKAMQQAEVEAEEEEFEEAKDELEDGFYQIEKAFKVDLTSDSPKAQRIQNAYRDFLLSIEPRGGFQEYPDFIKTFDLFKNSLKTSNSSAKRIASAGMQRGTENGTQAPTQPVTFKDAKKYIDSLQKN
jgi:hypothetical protein